MTWKTAVEPVALGLERTGYAHKVVIPGHRTITVASSDHRNWEHIHTEPLADGYVRQTGIGRREPDLTPCLLARQIAAVPEMLDYLRARSGDGDSTATAILDRIAQTHD